MVEAEDLLIFKLREKGKNPSAVEKPQTGEAAMAEPKAEAAPQQKPQVFDTAAARKPALEQEPVKAKDSEFSFTNFFGVKKKEAVKPQEAQVQQTIEEPANYTAQTEAAPERYEKTTGRELEEAKGKFCAWHPWRPAYAICDFCHKPYCYEDTVEFSRGYYCLEDIDKISENYAQELYASYSGIGFIAAGLFMFAFIAFVFFASGQLAYIFNSIMSIGWPAFVANINYSYGSALLGLVITVTGVLSAVLIVIQSNKGFTVGLVAGLAETVLFSYQFLSSGLLYMGILSAMGLVALMLLAYSKVSYEVPEQLISEKSIYHSAVVTGGGTSNSLSF